MKIDRPSLLTGLRALLLCTGLSAAVGSTSCTTADTSISPDSTVYPTAAEKNRELQEQMSSFTRTLM